ncbi:uncharacterized protein LOC117904214 [Vitis riparia]|uniref:uncharacterized protein LOC117904214 n=1 Tax=Vitis riparia TaxID=96939 RepID=UPI00155A1174|nr:uncharacterized protein LOC117904214 [Vitis riparia]
MAPPMKQLLETMCGGDFMNKNPDEAFQFLDYVAEVSRSWDEPIVKEPSRDRTMNRARASGVYTLPEGLDVQAKLATVMRRLDDLESKGVQEVQIVNEGARYVYEQANALGTYKQYSSNSPYSNTYNPGWRNHPNLSWRGGNNGQFQQQGNRFQGNQTNGQQGFQPQGMPSQNFQQQHQTSSSNSSLEDMMREFIQKQDKRNEDQSRINAQTSQELVDIRTTLSQLAVSLSQEKGKFPAQPQKNPRGVNEVSKVQKEDCNAVITLRNGKEYEGPKLPVSEDIPARDEPTVEKNVRNEKASENEEVIRHKVGDKTLEILEVLKQVKINIPLLDMIKQVPAYAKFLKDLCTQLGLGELKATTITLSLADRSIKVPRGVVEDVLVQVEKFYYPVDFVVLDTEPLKKGMNSVPIILGRPFLATANALINCRNGLMHYLLGT